ncbi:unnamed protein product [Meganyctiphanes norvegica]|uniref:Uncharacterized protein n=1 Tax=Meganyctiphanes norvegica TaxID=48144 RepID=A0AAV2QKB8_MEGNR
MLITSLLWLIPVCHSARESRKQYGSPHSVNLNGLKSQNGPFDYSYHDDIDYNFFPSYESSNGQDPFYGLDHHGFDNTDDRGGGDYYTDYDYYYDDELHHKSGAPVGHLTQEQKDDPFSIFYDSLFSDGDSVIPEESHLPEGTGEESYASSSTSSTSTTRTTSAPESTSLRTKTTSQQRYRPVDIPAQYISKPKTAEKKEDASKDSSTASPNLRPIHIPAHLITKPKPLKKHQEQSTYNTASDSLPPRLRPLNIPADLSEFISLPKPVDTQPISTQDNISLTRSPESTIRPKPSTAMKKPSKTPLDVLRLKRIMPLVLKQLGLPASITSKIFENEEAVNKLVKQLDRMDDFKGLLQHLDLGALATMMSGTDASVAVNLLQGSNLSSMTGILKSMGIDTSYIDGIFNRFGAAAAPPSTKAEDDDSKFLYLPLVDSGSVSNVQVIGFVVLLLFLLTTAYAYMEYGLLDAAGGTGSSYMAYDTGSYSGTDHGYDRHSTGGRPLTQNLGWADSSGLWLPVVESAEADAYYYPGPHPPEEEYIKDFTQPHPDSLEVSYSQQHEPWPQQEETYPQRETQPREPEEYYEYTTTTTTRRPFRRYKKRTTVAEEVQYTTERPYNRNDQRTAQRPRRPISSSTTYGARRPIGTRRTQQSTGDGQSQARRPSSTQNRRVFRTGDQNPRQSIGYRRKPPVTYRYNGNRRYSNTGEQNYHNPAPPRGYLQLKPVTESNTNQRSGSSNRRYIDDRLTYDEYYEDYDDANYYDYVSEENNSDYLDYEYYDDQPATVTEGRSNSDKPSYETSKPNSFHNQEISKLSALSRVQLSTNDKTSIIISSTTSSGIPNTPSTTLDSSSSSRSSQKTTPTPTTASTTPKPDIRPTSKIISTIKERRRQDTFTDEHSQDWLRFIHKLA